MNRAEYLLNCSLTYKESVKRSTVVPNTFDDEVCAKKTFIDVLLHEAKESFDQSIETPESLVYCPVDLESDEPGIHKTDKEIIRSSGPFPKINYIPNVKKYDSKNIPTELVEEKSKKYPKNMEKATSNAFEKSSKQLQKNENNAEKELEKEKIKEEKKLKRQNETAEEKKERLSEQRKKREDKKRKNEENSNGCTKEKKEPKPKFVSEDSVIMDSSDSIVIPKKPRRSSKIKYYDCPIPHDRHLYALERCCLNDVYKNILLNCEIDESKLFIIQGPPGTGKTSSLLSYVNSCPLDKRLLFCACTNVGAADIYTRLVMSGYEKTASLVLPPDRIPSSTVMMSDDPKRREKAETPK